MMLWRPSRVASDITHIKNSRQPFALKSAVFTRQFHRPFSGPRTKFFTLVRSTNHARPYPTSLWKSRPFHAL